METKELNKLLKAGEGTQIEYKDDNQFLFFPSDSKRVLYFYEYLQKCEFQSGEGLTFR